MKYLTILLALFALFAFTYHNALGDIAAGVDPAYVGEVEDEKKPAVSYCPKTGIYGELSDCLSCHTTPSFGLQEPDIAEGFKIPYGANLIMSSGNVILTYTIDNISSGAFATFFNYLTWHSNIKHIRLEVDSYGGSMFAAKSIIGFMDEFKASGGVIETVVRGKAMSAGFMIFLNGTKGERHISESAHLMWHQLMTFKMFAIDTPASIADESEVLDHLQSTQNAWIADRCKLTKKEIDALVHKKELWCNGKEAVEKYGFADKLIQ